MAQRHNCNATREIDILPALLIPCLLYTSTDANEFSSSAKFTPMRGFSNCHLQTMLPRLFRRKVKFTLTAVTGFGTVYLNLVRQTLARFHKADVKAYGNIRALSWGLGVGTLAAATAEYRIENIAEVYAVR